MCFFTLARSIGANAGYFGLLSLALGAEVLFVEPQPMCWRYIESAIIMNQFQQRATLVPKALRATQDLRSAPGQAPALLAMNDAVCDTRFPISGLENGRADASHGVRRTYVPVVSLHEALMIIGMTERVFDVVKLATEGSELGITSTNLIPLLRNRQVRHLIIEMTPAWWVSLNGTLAQGATLVCQIASFGYVVHTLRLAGRPMNTLSSAAVQDYLEQIAAQSATGFAGQEDFHFVLENDRRGYVSGDATYSGIAAPRRHRSPPASSCVLDLPIVAIGQAGLQRESLSTTARRLCPHPDAYRLDFVDAISASPL